MQNGIRNMAANVNSAICFRDNLNSVTFLCVLVYQIAKYIYFNKAKRHAHKLGPN